MRTLARLKTQSEMIVGVVVVLFGVWPALAAAGEDGFVPIGEAMADWQAVEEGVEAGDHWQLEDGVLTWLSAGTDLVSTVDYGDFELSFEWRAAEEASAGLVYRFSRLREGAGGLDYLIGASGEEFQAGSLVPLAASADGHAVSPGEWNEARIIALGSKIEHWLNGELVMSMEIGSAEWKEAIAGSPHAGLLGYGRNPAGRILIRDGGEIALRNMRLRNLSDEALPPVEEGWVSLFNGVDLEGWKMTEHDDAFVVEDGVIRTNGLGRSHLFYVGGDDAPPEWRNFELVMDVRTGENANSGVYFHTRWQDSGWPSRGYLAQIADGYPDRYKTGSLYGVVRQSEREKVPHVDGEWFRYGIRVDGNKVQIHVNGIEVLDWDEPDAREGDPVSLGTGTIALQSHDPESLVHFRRIHYRPLP